MEAGEKDFKYKNNKKRSIADTSFFAIRKIKKKRQGGSGVLITPLGDRPCEFKATLGYIVRPCIEKTKTKVKKIF